MAIENWRHDFNIGTVVRTANAFLAKEVHIVGNRRWNRRGAMVTDRYQHVRHHPTRRRPGGLPARRRASPLLGIDNLPGSVPLETQELPAAASACCSARRGRACPTRPRAACDGTFSIAQFGSTRSINAVAAAAIAMHAWMRQHADLPVTRLARLSAGAVGLRCRARMGVEPRRRRAGDPSQMPIATPEIYAEMLDRAKARRFAFPAINVTSSQTLNAALQGFAEAESDGIIQVSTGGAEYRSGPNVKDMVTGSLAFAAYAAEVAKNYPVNIALHTDHCPKDKLDGFVRPLLAASVERVKAGEDAAVPVAHVGRLGRAAGREPRRSPRSSWSGCAAANVILEIEVGVVGGEEDGVDGAINDKLYTTAEDALATVEALGSGEKGRYLTALTFGNVHGVYKPGDVKLRPEILKEAQEAVGAKLGLEPASKPFDLVFHGGSGSLPEEIADAVDYGVIKMNIDTDTQYAFTRPVADHMFRNYDGVLKVDGEVGNKKAYDPRAWGKAAEAGMAARVVEACEDLGSVGNKL